MVLCVGCSPELDVSLPEVEGAAVLLLAIDSERAVTAYANDLGDASDPMRVSIHDLSRLTAVYLDLPLGSLGIPRGRSVSDPMGRPIPMGRVRTVLVTEDFDPAHWNEIDKGDSSELPRFRIPQFSSIVCAGNSGCYRADRSDCLVPCPLDFVLEEPDFETEPYRPEWTPCPAGWHEVDRIAGQHPPHLLELCEPSLPSSCPAGQVAFVGSTECEPLGTACAEWPTPPTAPVRYVRAGAAGTTGTKADPFGTIAEAIAVLPPEGVVAIARGTYNEVVQLEHGITLLGACLETELVSTSTVVIVNRGGGSLENLTLRSNRTALLIDGARATIDSVQIVGEPWTMTATRASAITIQDGVLVAQDLVIEGGARNGILANASQVQLDRVLVRGVAGMSLTFGEASTATVSNLQIAGDAATLGINVEGSTVRLERALLQALSEFGLALRASNALLDTVVIRTIDPGVGLSVQRSTLAGARLWIEQNSGFGVSVRGSSTELELSDVALLDGQLVEEHQGFCVEDGTVTLNRVFIADQAYHSFFVAAGRTTVDHLTALRSKRGIYIQGDADTSINFLLSEDHGAEGIYWTGNPHSSLSLDDVRVRNVGSKGIHLTGPGRCKIDRVEVAEAGSGVVLGDGSDETHLEVRNAHLHNNRGTGLDIRTLTSLSLARFLIANNLGHGVVFPNGVDIDITEGRIRDNAEGGALVPPGYDPANLLEMVEYGPGQTIEPY